MSASTTDTLKDPAEPHQADDYRVIRIAPDSARAATRMLANEVAVAMEFDGQPYAVMMLTPSDFEDFGAVQDRLRVDGAVRFVESALSVFEQDIEWHRGGRCHAPPAGLPLGGPSVAGGRLR